MTLPYYVTWSQQADAVTLPIQSVERSRFYLENGHGVEDMASTSFQTSFGYSHRPIQNAIQEQLFQMPAASPKAAFALKEEASRKLVKFLEQEDGKIFYTVSGAEAVENALKMARQVSAKKLILARKKSYHGASLGALSITGDWRSEVHQNVSEWTRVIPEPEDDPDLQKTRQIIEDAKEEGVAAFCLETIPAANGVLVPPEAWWQGIQALCREYGIFLIVDEVACGFGRTGRSFAFHHYDLKPDFVCMSKAITGGYVPFGALWTGESIAQYYENRVLACGLTNYAHPLGLAAMNAVLDQFEDRDFQENLIRLEENFTSHLERIAQIPGVSAVRYKGLFAAIVTEGIDLTFQELIDQGIHLFWKSPLIVLAPPFVMSPHGLGVTMNRIKQLLLQKGPTA